MTTRRPSPDHDSLPDELANLLHLDAVPSTSHDALRARLVDEADRAGLLDVAYRRVDTPIGPLLVAATARGIVRIAFDREDHDQVLVALASSVSPRILEGGPRTEPAARQLDEYFSGDRRSFDLPIDLALISGFRRDVVTALPTIPYGSTASYAEVATTAGRPKAVRAVGSACSHNPVPVVIPCHRVVRSDGTIGQYLGGTDAKVQLLELESAHR